ncbi:SIMPL domain-containing protein [Xylophilus sp. GOD-11R]|uniref:SIMPL domain-containing protein n=1 Tax=Xylophilus sp. GOD-11R TaxID=3089814 RepID=UPI00298C9B25|nr:SIMPL domain-containing protein [Xylophilus sp. GOD-11R]WPB58593.1 SIMPL domain-containing protein [Xylophilus sp. GOD-11R]
MHPKFQILPAIAFVLAAVGAQAQTLVAPQPQNVVQLSTDGQVEVTQDMLSMTLSTTKEGVDPAAVQSQLKAALDAALVEARKNAAPGQLDVRTGNFGLYPRYSKDGKIASWQGSAELVLEGRDFPRITSTAGRISTLTLSRTGFGLSREQRAKVEGDAQSQAIERFKAKAADLSRAFGFKGYTLREVAVNTSDSSPMQRPRMMAMEAKAAVADAPVPVEAGKSTVTVNVSGSVQMN